MQQPNYSQTTQPTQTRSVTSSPSFHPPGKPRYPLHCVLYLLRAGFHFVLLAPWGKTGDDGRQLKSPIWEGWQERRPGFTSIKKHVANHGLLGAIPYYSNMAAVDVDQGNPLAIRTDFPPALTLPTQRPGGEHLWYPNPSGFQPPRKWQWDGTLQASGETVAGPAQYVVLWHDAVQQLADYFQYTADTSLQGADFRDLASALTWLDYQGRPTTADNPPPEDIPDLAQAWPGTRDFALYTYCLRWAYAHHHAYQHFDEFLVDLQEVSIHGRLQMPDLGPGGRDGESFTETDALNKARSAAGRVWQRKRQGQDSQDYPPLPNSGISSLSAPDFPEAAKKPAKAGVSGQWFHLGYRGDPTLNADSEEQRRRRARRTELDQAHIQRRQEYAALLYAVGHTTAQVATRTKPTAVRTELPHASLRTAQRDRANLGPLPSRRRARRILQSHASRRQRPDAQGRDTDTGRPQHHSPAQQKKGALSENQDRSFTTSGTSPPLPPPGEKDAASGPPSVKGLTALLRQRPARDGPPSPEDSDNGPIQAWICRACGHPAANLNEVQHHLHNLPLPQRQAHPGWDIIFAATDNGEDAMPPRGFNSPSTRRRGYPDVVMRSTLINHQGWTADLIKTHLGAPDEMGVNPSGRSRPDVALYHVSRVKQALDNNDRLRRHVEANLLARDLTALENPQVDPAPLHKPENRPRVHRIAYCATCDAWDPDGNPGDRCDIDRTPQCRRYDSRVAMLCPLTPCAEDQTAIFIQAGQKAAQVWLMHLQEEHS